MKKLILLIILIIAAFFATKRLIAIKENKAMEFIESYPKIDLHCHLAGSVRLSTLRDLAKTRGLALRNDAEKYFTVTEKDQGLEKLMETYNRVIPMLRTAEGLARVTYELLEDASRENVQYIEIRFTPQYHVNRTHDLDGVINAVLSGKVGAENAFPIKSSIIISINRDLAAEYQKYIILTAAKYRHRGITGIDFMGYTPDKDKFEIEKKTAKLVRDQGFGLTVHAGEFEGPGSIWVALENFQPDRIGHGISALRDPKLVKHLIDKNIYLEVCPVSNSITGAAKKHKRHPLKKLYKANIPVTLNTDGRNIMANSVVNEWKIAYKNLGLTLKNLININKNSVSAAFLPQEAKDRLLESIEAFSKK